MFEYRFSSMMHRKIIISRSTLGGYTSVAGNTTLSAVQHECLGKKISQKL